MDLNEYKEAKELDLQRYGQMSHLKQYLISTDYRIVFHYRKCCYYRDKKWFRLLYFFERLWYNRLCVKYGCDIPSHAVIGPGLRIDHANGIVINSKAVIGKNATLKGGVVIGSNSKGVPTVGDNVLIGAHALLIGKIIVGDNSSIGAGAIVVHDVPNRAVVVNQSATIIRIKE